ncbi:hypothetical protein IVG45_09615 [Methylomonas sp. LL1]|uniref:hypothetical protein n=1 Tax=Methylomonas sp. LL1 TaxID=2785785 RepID=UPI0018C36D8C|nr:hypothetical protein [Methylomonas sp. LL1]QPK65162.1 hypothetical protein IVG45_09615 [Methylomonas sp. LL1]
MTEKTKNQVFITDDSARIISHINYRLERLQDEIQRLKALDYLLTNSTNHEISELAWLVEPIAANMAAIQEELMDFSMTKGLAITTQTKPEAVND